MYELEIWMHDNFVYSAKFDNLKDAYFKFLFNLKLLLHENHYTVILYSNNSVYCKIKVVPTLFD